MATPAVFPTPVFEGSEKRIELCFDLSTAYSGSSGLRALSREQLDAICSAAHCCIVSCRSNAAFDAYVLSESSLFVYPHKVVLKTCGTTRLLDAVPLILELAAGLGAQPSKCRYSRASFLFPEQQPAPHSSFEVETDFLQRYFGNLSGGTAAYVMGDKLNGLQWHIYVADAARSPVPKPCYTLEVCMTGLCSAKARQFFRDHNDVEASRVTAESGIGGLVPGAEVDDYVFEPCGYSMNGIEDEGFVTVHITPEDGFSYASVELSGFAPDAIGGAQAVVKKVIDIFAPRNVSVSLTVDAPVEGYSWAETFALPTCYVAACASLQDLKGGGYVAYVTAHPTREQALLAPGSPRAEKGFLRKLPNSLSALSLGGSSATFNTLASCSPTAVGLPPSAATLNVVNGSESDTDASCNSSLASSMVLVTADDLGQGGQQPPVLPAPPLADEDLADLYALLGAAKLPCPSSKAMAEHAAKLVDAHSLEDNFYMLDLATVRRLYAAWTAAMPRVVPYYAVKCNTDRGLLSVLARLGAGFDCASDAEVDAVLELGVPTSHIIYANACKRPRDIRHAAGRGINLTTFDADCELAKLARWHPNTEVLLRIRADDPDARCQLGNKYGAEPFEWEPLLRAALRYNLRVVGVSFHVGSGDTNPDAFSKAIAAARTAFDMGSAMGHQMTLLDIGGGFAGGRVQAGGVVDLGGVPAAVNAALEEHFPASAGVRVIAEPGRYFAEAMATYATMVYGTRARPVDVQGMLEVGGEQKMAMEYWVTDGLYGAMNSVLYDHATLSCAVLRAPSPAAGGHTSAIATSPSADLTDGHEGPLHPTTVFGPTCDGLDTVLRDVRLPELSVGDWLLWPHMGAYTAVGASNFNGIDATAARVFYVASGDPW